MVAFEASAVNHNHHKAATDFDAAGIEYLHSAVSDHTGVATLLLNLEHADDEPTPVGWTSLLRHRGFEHVRPVQVPSTTLDDFVADAAGPIALWIDVEGAAGLVLDGAARTLSGVDVLKVEVEDVPSWEGQTVSLDIARQSAWTSSCGCCTPGSTRSRGTSSTPGSTTWCSSASERCATTGCGVISTCTSTTWRTASPVNRIRYAGRSISVPSPGQYD